MNSFSNKKKRRHQIWTVGVFSPLILNTLVHCIFPLGEAFVHWACGCLNAPAGHPEATEKRKNYLEQFAFVQGQLYAFYSWFIAILVLFKLSFMSKVLSCLQIIRKHSAACCLLQFLQGSGPLITDTICNLVKNRRLLR